jgi:hypothetical protein
MNFLDRGSGALNHDCPTAAVAVAVFWRALVLFADLVGVEDRVCTSLLTKELHPLVG